MINEYKVHFNITIFIDVTLFSFLGCLNLVLIGYEFLLSHQGLAFGVLAIAPGYLWWEEHSELHQQQ